MIQISRLFDIMKARGITAKKLSSDTGISQGNISDWKRGRSLPSLEGINTLSDYFDVSVDYLIGRTDAATVPESDISPKERYIINLFRQLTPDEQANITGRLELLVEQHEEAYRKEG